MNNMSVVRLLVALAALVAVCYCQAERDPLAAPRKGKRGLQAIGGTEVLTAPYNSAPFGGHPFGSLYGSPHGSIYGSASPYGSPAAAAALTPVQSAGPYGQVQSLGPIFKQSGYNPFGGYPAAFGESSGFPKLGGYSSAYSSPPFGVSDSNGYSTFSGYQTGSSGGLAVPVAVPTLSYSSNAY